MFDAALRARVERLLSGDLRTEDLTVLFLAMRERADGREAIIEIGDFVAHRDKRKRGMVTQSAKDFFTVLRSIYPEKPKALDDLPPNVAEVMQATFRRIGTASIKADTGMNRVAAGRALDDFLSRLRKHDSGRCFLDRPTEVDLRLGNSLMRRVIGKPAFDEDRLFKEFYSTLLVNGILRKKEVGRLEMLKGVIALYAASQMHHCIIDLGDGTEAVLLAKPTTGARSGLGVYAKAELKLEKPERTVFVGAPIFASSLRAEMHCEAEMLIEPRDWDFPIELNSKGRLQRLGQP